MTGDDCGGQEANGDGLAESAWVEDDGVDGVRGDDRRRVAELGFIKARGQLSTRPDGLLWIVGRSSLNEVYAFVRFKLLNE